MPGRLPVQKMQRLTGFDLLAHHSRQDGRTIAVKAITAGYFGKKEDGSPRVYFTQYFEAILFAKGWQKRIQLSQDNGGTETVKGIIRAIENKQDYKKRNDSVYVSEFGSKKGDQIILRFNGNLYAFIQYEKIHLVVNPEHRTRSTKERLNRILMRLCGCQLYQKNKVWYIYNPQLGDVEYKYGMAVPYLPKTFEG